MPPMAPTGVFHRLAGCDSLLKCLAICPARHLTCSAGKPSPYEVLKRHFDAAYAGK